MTDLHDVAERRRVEALIGEVVGVVAARIVPGYEREVDEVHVVSTPDRNPKQVVRDVQSLLYAQLGISIDHRVVSVVQIDVRAETEGGDVEPPPRPGDGAFEPPEGEPRTRREVEEPPSREREPQAPARGTVRHEPGRTRGRAEIVRVVTSQEGMDVRVTVSLAAGPSEYEGTATGTGSASGRRRAAARATLAAIEPLLPRDRTVELEGVAVRELLGHSLAMSLVHIHEPRASRTVSGTAEVRDAETNAIARSVLDAVNRLIRPAIDG